MIPLLPFANMSIYVVGLGKSGYATLAALREVRSDVWYFDDAQEGDVSPSGGIAPHLIPWPEIDLLVLSPGIPHTYPAPHKAAQRADDYGIPIVCDVDLLAQACPKATYVCVTGTNGKSTTTALLNHLLPKAQMGGNIGTPVLDLKPFYKKEDVYLLELSSYQLERVPHLKPDVAVWLNITPDHLERHNDMAGYVESKKNIFASKGVSQQVIIGIDDAESLAVFKELQRDSSKAITPISLCQKLEKGLSVIEGILCDDGEKVADLNSFSNLPGSHNHQNIAAAYGAMKALKEDVDFEEVATFKGLPHRQELIARRGDVVLINDSKATNIESTLRALACYENVSLIMGGVAKESGLQGLEAYKNTIAHVFIYGQAASQFSKELTEKNIPYSVFKTLEEATFEALSKTTNGTVLFSPACASFDQFKNFEERGDAFKDYVDVAPLPLEGASHV